MTKTILIVDDGVSMLLAVKDLLRSKGVRVLTATNGKEALEYIKETNPYSISLIITDLIMPLLDGISLIKEIRKISDYTNIPIIAMSSQKNENVVMEAKIAGANSFISKPFNINTFNVMIRNYFDSFLNYSE